MQVFLKTSHFSVGYNVFCLHQYPSNLNYRPIHCSSDGIIYWLRRSSLYADI